MNHERERVGGHVALRPGTKVCSGQLSSFDVPRLMESRRPSRGSFYIALVYLEFLEGKGQTSLP